MHVRPLCPLTFQSAPHLQHHQEMALGSPGGLRPNSLCRQCTCIGATAQHHPVSPARTENKGAPPTLMGNPTCETASRGGGQWKVWKQNMARENSRPPCYVRSLRRTTYLCKPNLRCYLHEQATFLCLYKGFAKDY